jgi:arsenate reductase
LFIEIDILAIKLFKSIIVMDCNDKNNCISCKSENLKHDNCSINMFDRKRILIICTGNSCRSQMAEGWLFSFDERLDVYSAGIRPEKEVNPYAIKVMQEVGIDISQNYPKFVDVFINDAFDYLITVCDNIRDACPIFTSNVKQRLHIGFEDPADAKGSPEEIIEIYRRIRDEIRDAFYKFYKDI